jgi:hypothetical protein
MGKDRRGAQADQRSAYIWLIDFLVLKQVDWRNKDTVITMDEHCGFKYLAHLEGYAYSGRLK